MRSLGWLLPSIPCWRWAWEFFGMMDVADQDEVHGYHIPYPRQFSYDPQPMVIAISPCSISNTSTFLKLYSLGRCWTTNGSIRNHMNSSPSAFWRMENSTVQLETRWTLHLGSVGGENWFFFSHWSIFHIIVILVEFALENILLIRVSHSLWRPFWPLLIW